ncbi:MAG TPA: hypothetical protein VFK70_17655, partial [Vicinamibacteria bacterium]|nr:hypothetical protein [Vicinamibacteria bacterium]
DRQQNIRLAMDLIQRDISTAGSGMDPWEQAFSRADGPNETGTVLNGTGPMGSNAVATDLLEVMGADGSCQDVPVDAALPPVAGRVQTAFAIPACFPGQTLAAFQLSTAVANDTVFWGFSQGNGVNAGKDVVFPQPVQPAKSDIAIKAFPVAAALRVMPISLARYAIATDAAGVPNLWRSGRGGLNLAGARTPVGDPTGDWQMIARGIEDLQVTYRPFGLGFADQPPIVALGNVNTLTQDVAVTLWARTLAPSLQGQTRSVGNVTGIHGSLSTVSTPRQVLQTLLNAGQWK